MRQTGGWGSNVSSDQRERLLGLVFAEGSARAPGSSENRVDPAVLADVIAGLVFAQRPITEAGKEAAQLYDLGPRGTFILSLVSRGVRYPKDLAIVLRVGRSLVSAELSRLTDAGLITATEGDDRRRTELSLTPLGESVNASVRSKLTGSLERSLAAYSADQIALFAQMLREVGRGAGR